MDHREHRPPIQDLAELRGKRVTLIGLSRRTNVALARFLVRQGAHVLISERRPPEELTTELDLVRGLPLDLRLGGHAADHLAQAEIVFVTPGAPRDLPILAIARERGIPISNEIELLFALCPARIIGITGSAGKTTTTTLVGQILSQGARAVYVGGNIGQPLIDQVEMIDPDGLVVLEVSSFQLETLTQSAQIGAILNITPNHLDRHPSFAHYRDSKFNLLAHQRPEDIAILGWDDPVAQALAPLCLGQVSWFSGSAGLPNGAFRTGAELRVRDQRGEALFAQVDDLRLPGAHNIQNVLAAAAISRAAGATIEQIHTIVSSFPGVEHRLEHVCDLDGVAYINDSIATSPERTVAALRSFTRPIVLIAGGRSKHLPMDELAREAARHVRAVITLGEMAGEIESALAAEPTSRAVVVAHAATVEEAVSQARSFARPGEVVLLSPAGTSYDQFRDFEERGERYKAAVHRLRSGQL